jgi:hypothetical protein
MQIFLSAIIYLGVLVFALVIAAFVVAAIRSRRR